MKVIKWTLLILMLLIVLITIGGYLYLRSTGPIYNGTVKLIGLNKSVSVKYDDYGIPHIYAGSEADAFFALGYVHAQDRLFQMELLRRVGAGRLSEIFGADMVEADRLFRTLGIAEMAKQSTALYLSADTAAYQQNAMAYLSGINQYIAHGKTPVEFQLMGIKKQPFTPEDIYCIIGYMSFNFAEALRSDPVFEKIKEQFGTAYLSDIAKEYQQGTTKIPVHVADAALTQISKTVTAILNGIPVAPWIGSNGWVLSPARSASGKVLFANDTHIGYSQPSVWYEAHLEAPGYSFYGNFLAGVPFGVVGHSRFAAWGLTMFENDDMDIFREKVNPGDSTQFWFMDHWETATSREETIIVKGAEPVHFRIIETRHGPVFNNAWEGLHEIKDRLSLRWTFTKFPSKTLQATYLFSKAKKMADFKEAVSWVHAPGLNVMYGDADGNIAWWTAAKITRYPEGVDAKVFLDGSSGLNEADYYPFSDNPHSENPPSGFVYSCNNQPDTLNGIFLSGYFYPEDRAKRLNTLLNAKSVWSLEEMKSVQTDVTSSTKPIVAKEFAAVIRSAKKYADGSVQAAALNALAAWDGRHELNDIAPSIYYTMMAYLLFNTMADELGQADFDVFSSTWCMRATTNVLPLNADSPWWDNVHTGGSKETRSEIFQLAFDSAVLKLEGELGKDVSEWTWNRVHTIQQAHPFGKKTPMDLFFNVGPAPVKGGMEVINNTGFDLKRSGKFESTYGPAMRILIDFNDVDHSLSVIPSGQSGNPVSPHYGDQFGLYNTGKYRPQMMNAKEIEATKKGELMLIPAQE
ncbi:MAG: penicillin acylase family protein [Chitinophagales bacterium]|nr:penicillin acylase family protein [Chitinophagales bacterium]